MIQRPIPIPVELASRLRVLCAHRIEQCREKMNDDPTGHWRDEYDIAQTALESLSVAMQKAT